MSEALRRRIRFLSKLLRWICIGGILFVPLLSAFPWLVKNFLTQLIDAYFSRNGVGDKPWYSTIVTYSLMRGMLIDMIWCTFLVAPLFVLAKLFRQYERCLFFSRKNICYLRWVAGLLVLQLLFYPFYLILQGYNYDSIDQIVSLFLSSLNDLKMWIVVFSLFLLAYITEIGFYLEDEYNRII